MRPLFSPKCSMVRPLLALTAMLLAAGDVAAQRIPTTKTIDSAYSRYGKVTSVKSLAGANPTAIATKQYSTPQGALMAWGTTDVAFVLKKPQHEMRPGVPVRRSFDGKKLEYPIFPITVPNTKTKVGEGESGGSFEIETFDLTVSLNPGSASARITGRTKVFSKDRMQGFHAAAAVRLLDESGNDVTAPIQVACLGTNPRSGDTKIWSFDLPPEQVALARRVALIHYRDDCGKSAIDTFIKNLNKTAEVIGALAKVYAATQAGASF